MENLRRRKYMTEESSHMAVANTILQQLGDRKFLAMTGAKNLTGFDALDSERKWPGLSFQLPIGKAKYVRIALSPSDTYTVQFMNRSGKVIKELDDIYSDNLINAIESNTGLRLSLGTMGRNEEDEMSLRRRGYLFEAKFQPNENQLAALKKWAKMHGRKWKEELSYA